MSLDSAGDGGSAEDGAAGVVPASLLARWRERSTLRTAAFFAAIVAAVLVVFHPIVFGGFSFACSQPSVDTSRTYADSATLPVLDPAAGASQDESWLCEIRARLIEGEVVLVNLKNGLGATFLESLQPGPLYLGNLVLPLIPGGSARLFDAFELLHVVLLVGGLFVLARLYARADLALAVALLVGLCGASYQHVNMVHFRAFAWSPWALAAAVRIARGEASAKHFVAFVVTHAAAISAGALQESFLSSLAIAAAFVIELATTPDGRVPRARRLATFAAAAIASTSIASPAFLPYLAARAGGETFSAVGSNRGVSGLDRDALFTLLVPFAHGMPLEFLRQSERVQCMTNFATLGAFLVVLGVVVAVRVRSSARGRKLFAFAGVVALGLLKVQHVAAFDWIERIPFVSEILFVKYHLWLFAFFAILAALGLQTAADLAPAERRRTVVVASAVLGLVLAAAGAWIAHDERWHRPDPWKTWIEYRNTVAVSLAACAAGAWLLWRAPKHAALWLVALVAVQALAVRPNGWFARLPRYRTTPGSRFLAASETPVRAMTSTPANQNLLEGYEALGYFDPVSNDAAHKLLGTFFEVSNAYFDLHPRPKNPAGFAARELVVARFCGVTHMLDVVASDSTATKPVVPGLLSFQGSLPRAFVVSDEAFRAASAIPRARKLEGIVDLVLSDLASRPALSNVRVGSNAISFGCDAPLAGHLVLLQGYSHAWKFEGASPERFCFTYPSWPVRLEPGRAYRARYIPRGLRFAIPLALFGLVLAAATAWRLRARARTPRSSSAHTATT